MTSAKVRDAELLPSADGSDWRHAPLSGEVSLGVALGRQKIIGGGSDAAVHHFRLAFAVLAIRPVGLSHMEQFGFAPLPSSAMCTAWYRVLTRAAGQ